MTCSRFHGKTRWGSRAALLASALALNACVSAQTSPLSWYAAQGFNAPRNLTVGVCHGFGCFHQDRFTFTEADIGQLSSIMAAGTESPTAERRAIRRAIMWMEERVGGSVGSHIDIGGLDLQNAGKHGQMDCIDETTNTTAYLLILQNEGLLRHHTVAHPVARGFFLDGRYPHATAVITAQDGEQWAVDPWPYANAEDVDVMTLDEWYAVFPLAG